MMEKSKLKKHGSDIIKDLYYVLQNLLYILVFGIKLNILLLFLVYMKQQQQLVMISNNKSLY